MQGGSIIKNYKFSALLIVMFAFWFPLTSLGATPVPQISSSTHPDSTKWYSNSSPVFSWELSDNINGVSYLITANSNSNPGPKSDGVVSAVSFDNVVEGEQYLHVKFREGNTWGLISHFQFKVDKSGPNNLQVQLVSTNSEIKPQIVFSAEDSLSGVDYYEVQVGDGKWSRVSADQGGRAYVVSFDRVGTKTVSVKAVDRAGNATLSSIPVTVSGVTLGLSLAMWIERIFNVVVDVLSRYGLFIILMVGMVGILILIFRELGAGLEKIWHKFENRTVVRKIERKVDSTYEKIINDMKDEIVFLNSISKRRKLGIEEKYLKSKLEKYIKALKNR